MKNTTCTVILAPSPNVSSPSYPDDSSDCKLPHKEALNNAVAGGIAGIISRTVTAPIERIKLMMQLQKQSGTHQFSSVMPFASKPKSHAITNHGMKSWRICLLIYKREGGLRAFWRGNTPNVLRQAGSSALNFMLMDCYKGVVSPIMKATMVFSTEYSEERREKHRKILSAFLSGGLAGGSTTTVLYPMEFMRTRLALDVGSVRTFPGGMRDVFSTIWKTDGIRGLYQGYGIALMGVIIYRGLHLGGYDAFKTELLHRRRPKTDHEAGHNSEQEPTIALSERFAMAQIVSISAGTICYPIDSVRRRLMMQAGTPIDQRSYTDSIDASLKIYKQEGIRGFYLGLGPNIVRSIAGAVLLVSYDVFKENLILL